MMIDIVLILIILGIILLISKKRPQRIWLLLAIIFMRFSIANFMLVYFSKDNWDLALYAISFYSLIFGLIFLIIFLVKRRNKK